tara:strand:+ start:136 stop:246 length:111 start_codon:yes stop_codon:yes gene_type:complete
MCSKYNKINEAILNLLRKMGWIKEKEIDDFKIEYYN